MLWQSEAVKSVLARRQFFSEEEKREKNRIRNQAFYRAKKAEYERVKRETAAKLARQEMTQAEADEQLDKAAPGWYKTIRELQKKIRTAAGGSAKESELQLQLNNVMQQNAAMAHQFQEQCQLIYDLFCPPHDSSDQAAPFPPVALQWPTNPSTEAYLMVIALVFPMSYWNQITEPESKAIRDCVLDLIHPDKADKLDQYLDLKDKASICAVFNASCNLVDEEMREWAGNRVKKAEWTRTWARVQRDIQTAYLPQSGSTPSFVAGLVFGDAYGMVQAKIRRDRERREAEKRSGGNCPAE
jgi:hypothetical protein